MEDITALWAALAPTFENWLRSTIKDEVSKALEADRQKQQPCRQYSRDEVCQMLNISKPTLWNVTKSGKLNATRIGRRVVYDEVEIKRFLGK